MQKNPSVKIHLCLVTWNLTSENEVLTGYAKSTIHHRVCSVVYFEFMITLRRSNQKTYSPSSKSSQSPIQPGYDREIGVGIVLLQVVSILASISEFLRFSKIFRWGKVLSRLYILPFIGPGSKHVLHHVSRSFVVEISHSQFQMCTSALPSTLQAFLQLLWPLAAVNSSQLFTNGQIYSAVKWRIRQIKQCQLLKLCQL